MVRLWKVRLATIALCLNFVGSLALFYSLNIIPIHKAVFTMPNKEIVSMAGVRADRTWLIRPGIFSMMIGFGLQLIDARKRTAD
jgi:hypothetical protein